MYNFIVSLIVIVSILLVFIIILQNPRGGGLSFGYSFAHQMMGIRKVTDLFERITWWLVVILVVLCILVATFFSPSRNILENSITKDNIMETLPSGELPEE